MNEATVSAEPLYLGSLQLHEAEVTAVARDGKAHAVTDCDRTCQGGSFCPDTSNLPTSHLMQTTGSAVPTTHRCRDAPLEQDHEEKAPTTQMPLADLELGKWLLLHQLPLEGVEKTGKYKSEALGKKTFAFVQFQPILMFVLRDSKRPLALPHTTPAYTLLNFPWGNLLVTLPLPTSLQGTFTHLPPCHKQL